MIKLYTLTTLILAIFALAVSCQNKDEIFDSYEDFLLEYYEQNSQNEEINFIKQHFPAIEVHMNLEEYERFLEEYLNDNLKGLDIHEEVAKIKKDHNEVLARAYVAQRGPTTNKRGIYELKDAFHDIIGGEFTYYLDTVEVRTSQEIAEEKEMEEMLEKEIEDRVKKDEEQELSDIDL